MKRLLYVFVILISTLSLCGCDRDSAENRKKVAQNEAGKAIENEIVYFRDKRTGLVYAYIPKQGHNGPALTLIPPNLEDRVKPYIVGEK